MANFKIALSAGHGRNTAGKRCMKSLDPSQTREWVLNSRIAEKVEARLAESFTGYELLRVDDRTGVKDVALSTRTKSANNWGADLYLAVHHNAGINGGTGGGIVAYVRRSPSDADQAWQKDLYNALIAETGLAGNRATPLDQANFQECKGPKCPAVLLELGFMDSKTDVPIILTEAYADQCAKAIVDVIARRADLPTRTAQTEPVKESTTAGTAAAVKLDKAQSGPDAAKKGTYLVSSSDGSLNLRAGAAASKQLIETMPNGTKVTCYGYYTGAWLYVVTGSGKVGFCHSGYLKKV